MKAKGCKSWVDRTGEKCSWEPVSQQPEQFYSCGGLRYNIQHSLVPRRDVKTHYSPVQTTPWTQDYRFNWSRVSLSSATALTTVLLNRRGSLVLDFIGSLPLFNRCLNLLTMLKQLAMEIMGLVCLPCSDVFLSAESLWQNWLEFANMFELPWNIIYGSTWYFPKDDDDDDDDKSNDNSCYCSGNSTAIFLFLLLYDFFTASYFFTYLQHIILHIFSYLFCFILSTAIHDGALMASLYILRCAVPRLLFLLSGPNPSQCYSSFPQVWCQWNRATSAQSCATVQKAEPLPV